MSDRCRGITVAAAAIALGAGIGVAALGGAGFAHAEVVGPAEPTAPATPCPGVPGPVGPPGVTDVPSAFGALMGMWRQARNPAMSPGQFAGPATP